jgi:hypothetical protein
VERLRCILLVVWALLWVGHAEAATVAILRPASDAPAIHEAVFRLQGELLAVGLTVALADRPPFQKTDSEEARAWFEQAGTERAIDAFIDVVGVSLPEAVDVWICERTPRRLRASRVLLEPNTENAAATLAIRAIEVLRSSFLARELSGSGAARESVAVPTRVEQRRSTPEHVSRLGLEAGATALTSFDGVPPAVLPLVRLDFAIRSWLTLQATGAGFGTRPRVEAAGGSVEINQAFGLLGLCVCFASGTGIHPLVALSVGALRTALDGQATAPNLGHRVARWTAVADGAAGARLSLPSWLFFTLAAHVQLGEPYVAIHVVDSVVGTTGRPNLLLTLTAGATL